MSNNQQDIVNQLLTFGIGTKHEILNAINNVINKNDINEIIDYIQKNQQKQNVKSLRAKSTYFKTFTFLLRTQ